MTAQLLAPLNPNERALSPLFQDSVDESMLREIAHADYGCMAGGRLREVLQLTFLGPPAGSRGAWMQLFACTALLQLDARYPESVALDGGDLAPFVSSALDLGETVARAAAAVLADRFLRNPGNAEDAAFLAFAILLLSAHVERRADRGLWLKELATWVESEEARLRMADDGLASGGWLLGLTEPGWYEGMWRKLARRILVAPSVPHPHEAEESLTRIGRLLLDPR